MKVLLLNSTYECIAFISIRKALKLYFNDKVEVLSEWDDSISWSNGKINLPSVMRLKYRVRFIPRRVRHSRIGVFRRDGHLCGYCGGREKFMTVDHILPTSRGGLNNWTNTITCCWPCNRKKGDRTPDEANMELLFKPYIPQFDLYAESLSFIDYHKDWDDYLQKN